MATDTNTLLIALGLVILIAIAVWMYTRKRRSDELAHRFGPEYDRTLNEMGSRDKAEAELLARKKRVDQLDIVPLSPADAQRFSQEWRGLQARFVDNPKGALADADQLVRELMSRRGYPMGDFERRAADISVHHPGVVEHYRAAHDIAESDRRGQVDTEGMRQAVIHYRALFAELLEVEDPRQPMPTRPEMRTQS
jgi:LPXTG-motif cell wall-anchored protein